MRVAKKSGFLSVIPFNRRKCSLANLERSANQRSPSIQSNRRACSLIERSSHDVRGYHFHSTQFSKNRRKDAVNPGCQDLMFSVESSPIDQQINP
ncbi:hypothetical protein BCEP27_70180 [Burkholderia cepacia]